MFYATSLMHAINEECFRAENLFVIVYSRSGEPVEHPDVVKPAAVDVSGSECEASGANFGGMLWALISAGSHLVTLWKKLLVFVLYDFSCIDWVFLWVGVYTSPVGRVVDPQLPALAKVSSLLEVLRLGWSYELVEQLWGEISLRASYIIIEVCRSGNEVLFSIRKNMHRLRKITSLFQVYTACSSVSSWKSISNT